MSGWSKWSKRFAPKRVEATIVETFGSKVAFTAYVNTVNEAFRWYRHNQELGKVVQAILDGDEKRVIICIPPGMSKSEMFSRLMAAAYLDRYPMREVGLVSYGASLAEALASDAREYFVAGGGKLDQSTAAKGDWKTLQGGGMWAKGFGGPIRGRRFHLGIIDDPHKGPEDLESEVLRDKFQRWWQRTWLNRQNLFFEEGAAIVVVAQRLADNDLIGWLLDQDDAEQWTVVSLDAIRAEEPWQWLDQHGVDAGPIPMKCKMWPDWRKPGELLCPELLGAARLKEQSSDEDSLAAQFMQRPKPAKGTVLNASKFIRVRPCDLPMMLKMVMGVDLALTEKQSADWAVGFPLGYGINGGYYFFRPYRAKAEAPDTEVQVPARARAMRCQAIGAETVAYQTSFVQHLKKDISLVGIPILSIPADIDKVARAYGWRPLVNQGIVFLVEDPEWLEATGEDWIEILLAEIRSFPKKKKDQIDAMGIAIATAREAGLEYGGLTGGQNAGNGYAAA